MSRDDEPSYDVWSYARSAREHSLKAFTAWVVAIPIVVALAHAVPVPLGWHDMAFRLEGEVVRIQELGDESLITFQGTNGGGTYRWSRAVDSGHDWSVGEIESGWVGTDGRFYSNYFSTARFGPEMGPFLLLVGLFVAFAFRNVVGTLVAWRDLRGGNDEPVLAYAALIDSSIPRVWRNVLLLWSRDPTQGDGLREPDRVFIADDEAGNELCSFGDVRVWQAWVDTGRVPWAKPRWVWVREGIFIPHRRALLAAWVARAQVRRAVVGEVVPMDQSPPTPAADLGPRQPRRRHDSRVMFGGRFTVTYALALVASLMVSSSEVVTRF